MLWPDGASHLSFPAALGAGEALTAPAASRSDRTTQESEPGARTPGAGRAPPSRTAPAPGAGPQAATPTAPSGRGLRVDATSSEVRGVRARRAPLRKPRPAAGGLGLCPAPRSSWAEGERPGAGRRTQRKAPVPWEVAPGPRRRRPCRCSPALDAATSPRGPPVPGYRPGVSAEIPAASGQFFPLPAEPPRKLHLCSAARLSQTSVELSLCLAASSAGRWQHCARPWSDSVNNSWKDIYTFVDDVVKKFPKQMNRLNKRTLELNDIVERKDQMCGVNNGFKSLEDIINLLVVNSCLEVMAGESYFVCVGGKSYSHCSRQNMLCVCVCV
ncbi:translation initiation factor IF-2-like [Mirounga leonina]|uniref:translation initiation factor IF-2-like n=1 Tax=Mirounga leonina TaxID=9715 RepID=UPI00156BDCF7|nr:translation initiation factor IF-2-like [Mirounga leonina]